MQHHYANKKKAPHQRNFKCKRTKTQKVQRVKTISVANTHAVKRSYNLDLEKFKESKLSSKLETRSKELLQMVWIIDAHDTIITTKSISLKILVWNMIVENVPLLV